jgi:hypothetical protein
MHLVPTVTITLDKPRTMRLDFKALEAAEAVLTAQTGQDVNIWNVLRSPEDIIRLRNLRALVWASLVHEDPELTPEQVGSFLHFGNFDSVVTALLSLREKGQPDAEPNVSSGPQESTAVDPQPLASSGSVSGPRHALTSA